MYDLSNKNVLVMDYGNYLEVGQRLSLDFQKVFYYNPNIVDGFIEHRLSDIGRGVEGIEKVKEWASIINEVDMVFFTDVFDKDLQRYFREIGLPVFGSGDSSLLETDRSFMKAVLERLELPIGKYELANGIDDLEDKLKKKKNVWVKSNMRGDGETWKHKKYILSKGELRRMKNHMSIFGKKENYIIEEELTCVGEIGCDTFNVNGRYPSTVIGGIELKDCCYIAKFMNYQELPKQIRLVMDSMSEIFSELGYSGWHSNEIMICPDKKGYFLDSTNRMPQPPTSIILNNIKNFSECAWLVANKSIPTIDYKYKYGCQLIIKSHVAGFDDTPIIVPEKYQEFVKIKNMVVDDDGVWYFTKYPMKNPDLKSMSGEKEIGSIVGLGNTIREAIEMAKTIAESLETEDAWVETGSIDKAQKSLEDLRKAGINFI
jgi:hypothetical protein